MRRLFSLAASIAIAALLLTPVRGFTQPAQPLPVVPPPMPKLSLGTDDPAWPNWPTERPPRPLPAPSVKFPPYEMHTLANGLRVVIVQQHEQPSVTLRMVIRAGAAYDPKDKAGVASLVAS